MKLSNMKRRLVMGLCQISMIALPVTDERTAVFAQDR